MKKILLGFIAIGLLTFVGCEKDDDTVATDSDGNIYQSVVIGTQEWMVENLRTTKYSDGTSIPNITGDTEWEELETGAWCHYDNNSDYESTYGKLYNWYAVETGKLCPTGWHVPTDAEWAVLEDYLTANGHDGTEGEALKSASDWVEDENGTDDYGWNGLPSGGRATSGSFGRVGIWGFWWSSSDINLDSTRVHWLGVDRPSLGRSDYSKGNGYSVRCLRD
jgi:uncharacterized protein (TIGR02145 family)